MTPCKENNNSNVDNIDSFSVNIVDPKNNNIDIDNITPRNIDNIVVKINDPSIVTRNGDPINTSSINPDNNVDPS